MTTNFGIYMTTKVGIYMTANVADITKNVGIYMNTAVAGDDECAAETFGCPVSPGQHGRSEFL